MPVDKFGHTDVGSSQRVIAGGVTLSQVNASFLRLDGANPATGNLNMSGHCIKGLPTTNTSDAGMDEALSWGQAIDLITNHDDSPSNDNHLTNKKYVDEQTASKVSKTGDTMTGNLFLNVGSDRLRSIGCKDLRGNKEFTVLLGNTSNKMQCLLNNPITLQTTEGFLCKMGIENIMRIGRAPNDRKIDVYQNILMNSNYITDLGDPLLAEDAATKNYVDKSLKKCHVGYIPNLEADVSVTGFVASASSNNTGHEAYRAFNNLTSGDSWFSGDGLVSWLQIKCPESVIIWRVAVKVKMTTVGVSITASNDGIAFTALLATNGTIPSGLAPTFLNISTTTAYQYYRLTVLEDDWLNQGIETMQLYIYDD